MQERKAAGGKKEFLEIMRKVSICIPAYNSAPSVRKLLESIEKQIFTDYEVIITDDSDGEEIKKLAEEKGYVKYYKNETPLGAAANWNAAIAKSGGEYVKMMHHDDWFTDENSLGAFVDMLERHPEADLAFSGSRQEESGKSYDRCISTEEADWIKKDYRNLYLGNTIGAPSAVIVRRNAIQSGIVYDEKLTWLVDMEYYMNILKRNPHFIYTEKPLVSIGVSEKQLTEACRDDKEINAFEYGYIYNKYQLESEEEYREKLIRILADAGKSEEGARAYGIDRKEYRAEKRRKLFSKLQWKMRHLFDDKLNIDKIGIWLLYLSVTLEILIVIIDKSNYINPIEGQLFRLTFLLAAGKVICTKYSFKEWGAILLFGFLGFLSYKATGRNEILRVVVFIAACKGTDMKKLLKYVFYMTTAGCLLLVILSVTGIYGGLALEANFGRGYTQVRYCFGLGHPNALHCMFMMLVLLGLYLYNEKAKWYVYAILFAMNYALYLLTDSNTGMLVTFCGIFGAVVIRYWKGLKERKWIYLAGIAAFLFCVGFSALAADRRVAKPNYNTYQFENPWIVEVESHLNGRIRDLYYGSIHREGTMETWSLFSRSRNNYYFDMGFVRLFYWYGIVWGLLYVIFNILLIWQFYKKKDGMGLVMLTVLSVYTVVEAHLVSVYIGRNYILFLMGMYAGDMLGLASGKEKYLWAWRKDGDKNEEEAAS